MESCADVIEELRSLGSASIKKVLLNHGAKEPFFGVKISAEYCVRLRHLTEERTDGRLMNAGRRR